MSEVVQATESDFEEKVYVIADEVLSILKDLSQQNKRQINSQEIAEQMFQSDSVKTLLTKRDSDASGQSGSFSLKEFSATLMERLGQLMPPSITGKVNEMVSRLHTSNIEQESPEWIDSPIKIIKSHIDTVTVRNSELEDFMNQTMKYLSETEANITGEMASQREKFQEDRQFENKISDDMNSLNDTVHVENSFDSIKNALIVKIDNINKAIEVKRDHDVKRLKDTEKTLDEMGTRMLEIKQEAEEIRKKSYEIEQESMRDRLTGMYNRKAYDDRVAETLAHVTRYNIKATLMICDIDYFKKINDTFGHNVGDLALKKLASLLKERLRTNDFIARYGGEEFAVILPHTDLEGGLRAGEGIRSYISDAHFSYKNQSIPLTISVGISAFSGDDDVHSVFERADRALYQAKNSGRNAVMSESDITDEGEPAPEKVAAESR